MHKKDQSLGQKVPAYAVPKQAKRNTRFKPGQSGNPAGKKPGTRHAVTILAERLMGCDVERVVKKVIDAALAGDMTAARLIVDRMVPVRRSRTIHVDLPPVDDAAGVAKSQSLIIQAVAAGRLDLEEGAHMSSLLEARRRAIESEDHERRLRLLEGHHG